MTPQEITELMTAKGEIVPTSQLKTGDIIRNNGCLMEIGTINSRHAAYGTVYWTAAKVWHRATETIPQGWFDRAPDGSRTWQVQGNDRASWLRVKAA